MPGVGTSAYSNLSEAFSLVRSLLNDADIPSILTITQAGAVRAGNIVTITTNLPHGLQIGAIVQVASVSDASFNGSQTVFSVPSSTTFTYQQTGGAASSGNGTVSVLIQGDWATDAVLLPLANKAYRQVQNRLLQAGSKTATNDVILSPAMAIGQQQLSDTSSPQLPPDFLAPRELFERISGQTYFSGPMWQVDALPSRPQTALNGCFSWYNDCINFVGALNSLDVRLRYFCGFPRLSDATSQIAIRGAVDPVASYTAMLAANSRNAGSGAQFAAMFEQDMSQLLNMQVHARQYKVGRRRPNNSRRSGWGNWGGSWGSTV